MGINGSTIYLREGQQNYYIANSNDNVYATSSGIENIIFNSNVHNVTVDSNTDQVELPNAISTYKFAQSGNLLKVYELDGTTLVSTIAIDEDGSKVKFSDTNPLDVSLIIQNQALVMTIDGTAISSTPEVVAVAPVISSVSLTDATNIQNNTLNEGDVLSITVAYDSVVDVVTTGGTPTLEITIGGATVNATYASGTGSANLVFNYTILAEQTDSDGISIGANALSLNGATIKDTAGNTALITHDAVTDNSNFKVDTEAAATPGAPDLGAQSDTGNSNTDNITNNATPTIVGSGATEGDTITLKNGPTEIGTATVDSNGEWSITPQNPLIDGTHLLTITATDPAGNISSSSASLTITIDTAVPTATTSTDTLPNTESIMVQSTETGTAYLVKSTVVNFDPLTTDDTLFNSVSIGTINTDTPLALSGLVNGDYKLITMDTAGNVSNPSVDTITIDSTAPSAPTLAVSSQAGIDGTYIIGDTITVTATYNENVVVDTTNGTPYVTLSIGSGDKNAQYTSGSSTSELVFSYTLVEGDLDADGIAIAANALALNNGTIKDEAGNTATITHTEVVASTDHKIDAVIPTISTATIDGNTVVLTYDETLANSAPNTNAFSVMKNGVDTIVVNQVTVSGTTVTLTLSSEVLSSDAVTITYDNTAGTAMEDSAGNDAASLTNYGLTNNTEADGTPPTFSSATVNGNTLVMTYTENKALDDTNIPSVNDFSVINGGNGNVVTNVVVDATNKTITLTLTNTVVSGEAVTIAYTDPTVGNDVNAIQDTSGNDAATLAAQNVTNTTPDTTAPTSTITKADYFEKHDLSTTGVTENIIKITGTNFDTILENNETATTDIKARLDWSKLVWDINNDDATTADVTFESSNIESVFVANSTTMYINLTSQKATELYGTTGYNTTDSSAADGLNIAAGFIKDIAGNIATTDAFDASLTSNQYIVDVNDSGTFASTVSATDIVIHGTGTFSVDGTNFNANPTNIQVVDASGETVTSFSMENLDSVSNGLLSNNTATGSMTVNLSGAVTVGVQATAGTNSIVTIGTGGGHSMILMDNVIAPSDDILLLTDSAQTSLLEAVFMFSNGTDKIKLDSNTFGALDGADADINIDAEYFISGADFSDTTQRLLYDTDDDILYYDADGNGGDHSAVALVQLGVSWNGNPHGFLTINDIEIA